MKRDAYVWGVNDSPVPVWMPVWSIAQADALLKTCAKNGWTVEIHSPLVNRRIRREWPVAAEPIKP